MCFTFNIAMGITAGFSVSAVQAGCGQDQGSQAGAAVLTGLSVVFYVLSYEVKESQTRNPENTEGTEDEIGGTRFLGCVERESVDGARFIAGVHHPVFQGSVLIFAARATVFRLSAH